MIFLALLAALLAPVSAQDNGSLPYDPNGANFIALAPSLSEYTRFADGGPDENWYIGFNNAWIVKLPPAPAGDFKRAFIGARVGRAKTRPNEKKPWVRELIDGKVYMAISQQPAWSAEQSFFLAETADIPVEGDPQNHVAGIGSAEWFWAEVSPALVSFTQPNYLIIWSPTKSFLKAAGSPILAAAAVDEPRSEPRAWNNNTIIGVPPRSNRGSLQTPIMNISPALAIKLVPPNEGEVAVSEPILMRLAKKSVVEFSAHGEDIVEAWVESSRDQLDWARTSNYSRRPPYSFVLAGEKNPGPGWFLRGVARDARGNLGESKAVSIPYAPR